MNLASHLLQWFNSLTWPFFFQAAESVLFSIIWYLRKDKKNLSSNPQDPQTLKINVHSSEILT